MCLGCGVENAGEGCPERITRLSHGGCGAAGVMRETVPDRDAALYRLHGHDHLIANAVLKETATGACMLRSWLSQLHASLSIHVSVNVMPLRSCRAPEKDNTQPVSAPMDSVSNARSQQFLMSQRRDDNHNATVVPNPRALDIIL